MKDAARAACVLSRFFGALRGVVVVAVMVLTVVLSLVMAIPGARRMLIVVSTVVVVVKESGRICLRFPSVADHRSALVDNPQGPAGQAKRRQNCRERDRRDPYVVPSTAQQRRQDAGQQTVPRDHQKTGPAIRIGVKSTGEGETLAGRR